LGVTNTLTYLRSSKNYLNLYKYTVYLVGSNSIVIPSGGGWSSHGTFGSFFTTPFLRWDGRATAYSQNNSQYATYHEIKRGSNSSMYLASIATAPAAVSKTYTDITTFSVNSTIGEIIPDVTLDVFDKDNNSIASEFNTRDYISNNRIDVLKSPGNYSIGIGNVEFNPSSLGGSTVTQNLKEFRLYVGTHTPSQRNSVLSELKTKWGIV
jgi:hypothetical protein